MSELTNIRISGANLDAKGTDGNGGVVLVLNDAGIPVANSDPSTPGKGLPAPLSVAEPFAGANTGLEVNSTDPQNVTIGFPNTPNHPINPSAVSTPSISFGEGARGSYADVRLMTAANIAAHTSAGAGPGKTMTATSNGTLTVDTVVAALGDRIGVKNSAVLTDHGIYVVTQAGDGSHPWILTRATDFDTNAKMFDNFSVGVAEGATNGGKVFSTDINRDGEPDSSTMFSDFHLWPGAALLNDSTGLQFQGTDGTDGTHLPTTLGTAIPDATDAASTQANLNLLLAFLRNKLIKP